MTENTGSNSSQSSSGESLRAGDARDHRRQLLLRILGAGIGGITLVHAASGKPANVALDEESCGTYNSSGGLNYDLDCATMLPSGERKQDRDCGASIVQGGPLKSGDNDCGQANEDGSYSMTDFDCGKQFGTFDGNPTYHSDEDCGQAGTGADLDCGKAGPVGSPYADNGS